MSLLTIAGPAASALPLTIVDGIHRGWAIVRASEPQALAAGSLNNIPTNDQSSASRGFIVQSSE